jgi:pimeloyl-ACP methyl ester carboxylesterase
MWGRLIEREENGMSISAELGDRHTVDLPQGTIAYRETGDGPPIVFIHGLLVNGDHWRKVVPLLANGYRCIAPDLPLGAHETPLRADADLSAAGVARLIADFIAALDLDDVTVIANDTGDVLAQVLVTEHPERIARLVLTPGDAFTNFLPWLIKPLRVLGFAPPLVSLLARGGRNPAVQKAALVGVARNLPPADVLDGYTRPPFESAGVRRDLRKFFRHASPSHTVNAARKLRELRIPALIVWTDERSPLFPKAHGRRLAKLIPDARYEEVGKSRAFIPEDRPDRLAELIREFVPEKVRQPAG